MVRKMSTETLLEAVIHYHTKPSARPTSVVRWLQWERGPLGTVTASAHLTGTLGVQGAPLKG